MNPTGLYFGSFNPMHNGHLIIASYMVETQGLQECWFVVSPHNPLKKRESLLPDHHRIEMVRLAIGDDKRFRVCDIETRLPQPSYTINTLVHLEEKYPKRKFVLIAGSDNLENFHKWKNHAAILSMAKLLIYPRPGFQGSRFDSHAAVTITEAPQMDISSSQIRQMIAEGKSVRHFMPEAAFRYLDDMNFYKKQK